MCWRLCMGDDVDTYDVPGSIVCQALHSKHIDEGGSALRSAPLLKRRNRKPPHQHETREAHEQVSRETLRVPNVPMLCPPVTMPALIVLTGYRGRSE